MKIGHRVKECRELKRLSQGELARRVGVTQPSISDWETGKSEPSVDNLRILAVELNVWFEWLATGRGPRDYIPGTKEASEEYRIEIAVPPDEQNLQTIYRKLSPNRRQALLEFLQRWS